MLFFPNVNFDYRFENNVFLQNIADIGSSLRV